MNAVKERWQIPEDYQKYFSPLCIASFERYVNDHIKMGDFLTAVVENNLTGAVLRADDQNKHVLREWLLLLHNEAPPDCFGSKTKADAWIGKGGVK